jgi:hypothetical protein
MRVVRRHHRGALGEPVAFDRRPAEIHEAPEHFVGQRRRARHQEPQPAHAGALAQPPHQPAADPAAGGAPHDPDHAEQRPHQQPARDRRDRNAAIQRRQQLLAQQRHTQQQRGLRGPQILAQLVRLEAARVGHARAGAQRTQQPARALQGVVQRQHRQQPVGGAELERASHRLDVAEDVGVREHDPLGLSGRAGGEDEHRQVIGLAARRQRLGRGKASSRLGERGQIGLLVEADQAQGRAPGLPGLLDHLALAAAHDAEPRLGRGQDLAHFLPLELGIERDHHRAGLEDPQVRHAPFGTILALKSDARPRAHSQLHQQPGESVYGAGRLIEASGLPALRAPGEQE